MSKDSIVTKCRLKWGEAYKLGVELREAWLARIIKDEDGVDHLRAIAPRRLNEHETRFSRPSTMGTDHDMVALEYLCEERSPSRSGLVSGQWL